MSQPPKGERNVHPWHESMNLSPGSQSQTAVHQAAREIEQEMKMVSALKRLSIGNNMNYDPDLPRDDFDYYPSSPKETPRDDILYDDDKPIDTTALLWVPANLHPELAPEQFRLHVKSTVDEIMEKRLRRRSSTASSRSSSSSHGGQSPSRIDEISGNQEASEMSLQDATDDREKYNEKRFSNPSLRDLTDELEKLSKIAGMDATDAVTLARTLSTSSLGYTDVEKQAIDELTSPTSGLSSPTDSDYPSSPVSDQEFSDPDSPTNIRLSGDEDRPIAPGSQFALRRSTWTSYKKGSIKPASKGERLNELRQTIVTPQPNQIPANQPPTSSHSRDRERDSRKHTSMGSTSSDLSEDWESRKYRDSQSLFSYKDPNTSPLSPNANTAPRLGSPHQHQPHHSSHNKQSQSQQHQHYQQQSQQQARSLPPQSMPQHRPRQDRVQQRQNLMGNELYYPSTTSRRSVSSPQPQVSTSSNPAYPMVANGSVPLKSRSLHSSSKTSTRTSPNQPRTSPRQGHSHSSQHSAHSQPHHQSSSSQHPPQQSHRSTNPSHRPANKQQTLQPAPAPAPTSKHQDRRHRPQLAVQTSQYPTMDQNRQMGPSPVSRAPPAMQQKSRSSNSPVEQNPVRQYEQRSSKNGYNGMDFNDDLNLLKSELDEFKNNLMKEEDEQNQLDLNKVEKQQTAEPFESTKTNDQHISESINSRNKSIERRLRDDQQKVAKRLEERQQQVQPSQSDIKPLSLNNSHVGIVSNNQTKDDVGPEQATNDSKPMDSISALSQTGTVKSKLSIELSSTKEIIRSSLDDSTTPSSPISETSPGKKKKTSFALMNSTINDKKKLKKKKSWNWLNSKNTEESEEPEEVEEPESSSVKEHQQNLHSHSRNRNLAMTDTEMNLISSDIPSSTKSKGTRSSSELSTQEKEPEKKEKENEKEKEKEAVSENFINKLFSKNKNKNKQEKSTPSQAQSVPSASKHSSEEHETVSENDDSKKTLVNTLKKKMKKSPSDNSIKSNESDRKSKSEDTNHEVQVDDGEEDEEKLKQKTATAQVQEKLKNSIKRHSKANQPIEFTDSAFGFPLPPPSHSTLVMLDYRFPIHVERAIYRLSHLKLANPKRSLREQVLLSNFMYAYLNLVNHTLYLQQMTEEDDEKKEQPMQELELDENEGPIPIDLDDADIGNMS